MAMNTLAAALADRYRIERELGAGGMATVYLAEDLRHGRKVAIKVLKPELAAVIGAERFVREIRTIATLQHPHILGLIDSGEADGTAYYVMPYVEGESLRDRLNREKQLPVPDAIRIATEVASALDYAHRHGVIHRDIKPENILLHDGSALVADFGIALAVSSAGGGTRMTETGMSLGTPHYMSPEQAMGEREIGPRSDVYALGCVTYEMLVGDPPFLGSTVQAIVAKVMTEKPAPPSSMRDTVPETVEATVLAALSKLPADRPSSAAEFAAGLAGDGTGHRTTRSAAVRASSAPGPWRRVSAGLGVAAVLSLGLAAWTLARSPRVDPITVFDAGLPDSAAMYFTGQSPSTPYGSPLQNLSLAPDGSLVVYLARQGESTVLWRHGLRDGSATLVAGTTGGSMPRVSPDGREIAFLQGNNIMVVPVGGGEPRKIVDSEGQLTGLDWIGSARLMAVDFEGYRLRLIDTEGGASQTTSISRCVDARWMPQERRLLCSLGGVGTVVDPGSGQVWTVRNRAAQGAAAGPVAGSAFRRVAGNYLVYESPEGDLRGAPLDPGSYQVGRSATLVGGIRLESIGTAQYDVDSVGTLIYAPGGNAETGQLVRLQAGGSPTPLPVPPGAYQRWDLSRDGRSLATVTQAPGYNELRIHDLRTGQSFVWLRAESVGQPLWSPDGSWLLVNVQDSSQALLLRGSPFSGTPPDTVLRSKNGAGPALIDLHDTHDALAVTGFPGSVVGFDPMGRPVRLDTIASGPYFTSVSPDGRRLLFSVSAGSRVVVSAMPPSAWERQIAANAVEPLWLSDSEVLYRSGVTWHMARIEPATGEPTGDTAVWGSDPRFSDTFGWSNRPSWDGGIIYLQGPPRTDATYLRIVPHWIGTMRAGVDGANR